MTNHIFYNCDNCGNDEKYCDDTTCYYANLDVCKVCKLSEGSLTTHCSGRPCTPNEEHMIYDQGILDYKNSKWTHSPNPTNQLLKHHIKNR